MSTVGVERDSHFIGSWKWGGWRVGGVWHSQTAQARLEVQMSANGHFIGAGGVWVACGILTGCASEIRGRRVCQHEGTSSGR